MSIPAKRCPRCKTIKPASEFYASAVTKSGLSSYCKHCDQRYRVERRRELIPKEQKRCIACEEVKPLSEFWKDYRCLDGHSKKCQACEVTQRKALIEHDIENARKVCSYCRAEKSLEHFYKNAAHTSGYHARCKECEQIKTPRRKETLPDGHKRCSYCKEIKPFSEFYASKTRSDGYCYECKKCRKERSRLPITPHMTTAILPTEHTCKKCGATKPVHEFSMGKSGAQQYKLRHWCRECDKEREIKPYSYGARRHQILKTYGITPDEYDAMHEAQNGKCAICNQEETATQRGKTLPLAVDHCHATKKVRGLLCSKCNRALGVLGDDINRVENMLTYLKASL